MTVEHQGELAPILPTVRAQKPRKHTEKAQEPWTLTKSVVNLGDMGIQDKRHGLKSRLIQAALRLGVCVLFAPGVAALAGEPPETLPAPRPVNPPAVVVPAPPVYRLYTPPLSRDVWQAYGVDYKGFWRPRVAFMPQGDFYLYNGAPFFWADSYPHWFNSRVRGD
jgi:hypothetical protein